MTRGSGIVEFERPRYRTSWWFVGIGIAVAIGLIGYWVWLKFIYAD